MEFLKRSFIYIKRKPKKNFTLFILIFILGNLISGAISIRQAFISTEENLRAQLPALTSITIDWEAVEQHAFETGIPVETIVNSMEWITPELMSQVASLADLRAHDFAIQSNVITRGLQTNFIPSVSSAEIGEEHFQNILGMAPSLRSLGIGDFESISLQGVQNENIADIAAKLISITSGQSFTQEQLNNGEPVALISNIFADENDLQVGSVINLESVIFDWRDLPPNATVEEFYNEDIIYLEDNWEITIIGIYEITHQFDYSNPNYWMTALQEASLQQRIYLPNQLVNEMAKFTSFNNWEVNPFQDVHPDDEMNFTNFFVLENPRDINSFIQLSEELLPDFWVMGDLSNAFRSFSSTMDTMLWIADFILYIALGSVLLITSLLITLFLRDRKQEIGIYLSLGEKKLRIVFQILLEVFTVSTPAVLLSIFSGHLISSKITTLLLEIQLNQQQSYQWNPTFEIPWGLQIFSINEMSMEKMMAVYDTSLSVIAIITFLTIGFGTILISTVVPILYALQLSPKKILM